MKGVVEKCGGVASFECWDVALCSVDDHLRVEARVFLLVRSLMFFNLHVFLSWHPRQP